MKRFFLAGLCVLVACTSLPAAEACTVICDQKSQPRNASERAEQVRKAVEKYDYIFVGEVVSIGPSEAVKVRPNITVDFNSVTIRTTKIIKGDPTELITVRLVLDDGGNCGVDAVVGEYFEGIVKQEPTGLIARAVGCDTWAIFEEDGPLPRPTRTKPGCK